MVEKLRQGHALSIVSRLDHPTSGVLPLALGGEGSREANWLRGQFAGRLVYKEYLCLCEGPCEASGEIDLPLLTKEQDGSSRSEVSPLGRAALTKYRVLQRYRLQGQELTLLSVKPMTGRTHQIRVHMASIQRPLLGDLTYGRRSSLCPRLFLHCHRIRLLDLEDQVFSAESALPEDLAQVLKTLEPLT